MKRIAKKLVFVALFCLVVIVVIGQFKYYIFGQKLVTENSSSPQWSKDGKSIYWFEYPGLASYDVYNGVKKTIYSSRLYSKFSLDDLSPDNVNFVGCDYDKHDLAITSIDSGKSKVIYHTKDKISSTAWISGDLILVALYPGRGIYTIHANGTGLARVCDGNYFRNVSSDGREFVHASITKAGYETVFYDLKYHLEKTLTQEVRLAYLSRKAAVYYKSDENGKVRYWLLDLTTMKAQPLYISRVATYQEATISPDLSHYLWEKRNGSRFKLYVATLPPEVAGKIKHIEAKN